MFGESRYGYELRYTSTVIALFTWLLPATHEPIRMEMNYYEKEREGYMLPFVGVLGETMRIAPQLLVQVTLGIITQTAMFLFVFYEIVRNVIFILSEICVVAGWSLAWWFGEMLYNTPVT